MEQSILKNDLILLIQTKNRHLERLLANSVVDKSIRLEVVESPDGLNELGPDDRVVSIVIGSDIQDPIRSAQRLHAIKNNAKIILLSNPQNIGTLKDAVKYSPFIGGDVYCLDETKEEELNGKLNEVLERGRRSENYRTIIAETNSRISLTAPSHKAAFNQNFINKLLDIAPVGIAIADRNGNVLGWNRAATAIFARSETQVLGKPLSRLFGRPDGSRLKDYLQERFEKSESDAVGQLTLERESPGGSRQILSFTAAPFTYAGETEQASILAIQDVTRLKQTEKELQQMNATLEERVEERTASLLSYQHQLRSLASRLSTAEEKQRRRLASELHDNLGQMLVLSKMKISLLQRGELPEETAAYLEDIKKGVDDALAYTRDLMSDLMPPPSLNQEDIRASMEWLADHMKKYDIRVIFEDDGKPKPVNDKIRITLVQCVRELLFNIIKHAGVQEGRIALTRLKKEVEIVVEDKGKGFDVEADRSVSQEGGFGLFNISERIDLLGGSLDIESEPGKGTKVTICAPVTEKAKKEFAAKSGETGTPSQPPDKPGKIRVLLVDDHKMIREGLRKIVNEQDDLMVIAEASDGKEALRVAGKTSPDIVVMDVNMPVMDGIKATRKLKEMMPEIRVIALSFHNHQKVMDSMKSAGANAYLTKNEAFETLCATIRNEADRAKA